ncbi:MAG: WD40 repeat domain-containing protein, partial [Cyanobacteria bacterium J06555_13]
ERSVQIYDYDGNQIAKLQGTRATLVTMGESSSDTQLIVDDGSNDLAVIYDLNGNQQVELKGLFSRTTPDGALLITSSRSDNLTRLYTPAGEQVQSYEGRYRNFSKDGQLIATYFSKEDETRVYDRTGIEIGSFEGQDAQFSWDGQRLLTVGSGGDRTARFYSVNGNNTLSSVKQSMVVLSEDGQLMVSVSEALETTQLRDLETEAVITLPGTFAGFTPDETGIAIASSQDNTIRLYDLSGTEQLAVEGSYLSFSADGESVITVTDEGESSTRLYDRAGNKIANLAVPFATFSPDGNWIVGGSFNDGSVVTLYDRSGNRIASFEGSSARFSPDSQYVISTAIDFNSLRRSPNHNAVRTYLYDLSGNRLASLQGRLVGFTPDNQRIITSSVFGAPTPGGGPSSWLYDFTGNEITHFTDPLILDFDAEGERVLTSSRGGGRSRLHDLNGNEIRSFEDSSPRFIDALQQIAVYSADDESTEFYDFAGQVTGPTSQGQTIQGRFKAYSPSGEYFVTNAYREDISRVYDAAGRLQAEFPGAVFERSSSDTVYISLEKPTNSLGFTPDGQRLLTQTKDGVYHLWTLDNGLEDLLARGCDWVRPYLDKNENETRAAFCRQ